MAVLALGPVSDAVYTALNVTALTNKVAGGVHSDVPATVVFPFVLYAVWQERDDRGFGTGAMPKVIIRLYVFTQYGGFKVAHAAMEAAIPLLKDQALSATGFRQAGLVFHTGEVREPIEAVIKGVKCNEISTDFYTWMEAV